MFSTKLSEVIIPHFLFFLVYNIEILLHLQGKFGGLPSVCYTLTTIGSIDKVEEKSFTLPIHLESEDPVIFLFLVTFSTLGILGNASTLGIIICAKYFHKPPFMVIGTLALADLVSLFQYLSELIVVKLDKEIHDQYNQLFMTLIFTTAHASASHVVLLIGLRYYFVVTPLRARTKRSRVVNVASSLLWVFSVIFGLIYYAVRFNVQTKDVGTVVLFFRGYLLCVPCIFMGVFHCRKINNLRNSLNYCRISRQVRQMSAMILVIMSIYILSATFFPIAFSLHYYRVLKLRESKSIHVIARTLWLTNLSANPLIYFIYSPKVRQRVSLILRRKSFQQTTLERSSNRTLSMTRIC